MDLYLNHHCSFETSKTFETFIHCSLDKQISNAILRPKKTLFLWNQVVCLFFQICDKTKHSSNTTNATTNASLLTSDHSALTERHHRPFKEVETRGRLILKQFPCKTWSSQLTEGKVKSRMKRKHDNQLFTGVSLIHWRRCHQSRVSEVGFCSCITFLEKDSDQMVKMVVVVGLVHFFFFQDEVNNFFLLYLSCHWYWFQKCARCHWWKLNGRI